jgi:hypothetical protein
MELNLLLALANNVFTAGRGFQNGNNDFNKEVVDATIRAAYNNEPIPDAACPHDTLTNLYSEVQEICHRMFV